MQGDAAIVAINQLLSGIPALRFPPVVYTSSSAMLVMEYKPQVVALIVYLECLESTMQGIPVWPNLKILPFFLQIKAALLMFTYVKNANVPTKMVM